MANQISFKKGVAGSLPSSGLVQGEPLYNTDDYKFYIASSTSAAKWTGAPILDYL